jgi:acetyl-CoA carboxylase beta subunit
MHWLKEIRKKEKEKEKEMTVADDTNNQQQLIHCPNCGNSIFVDALGKHVNTSPEIIKEAIERISELWGDSYDRNYLIQNVVFCTSSSKLSHFNTGLIIIRVLSD